MGSNAAAPTPTPPFKPPICPDGLGLIITELGCSHQGGPYTSGSVPGLPIVQPTTTATSASTVAVSAITNNTPKRHTSTNIASISSSSPTESTMSSTTAATIPAGSDISSMSSSPAVSSNYTSASLSSRSLNGTDTSTIVSTSMSTSSPAAFESSSSTQSYATPMTLQYATDGSGAGSSTAGVETFTGAQSSATSSLAFSSKHSNHTGAIVGGVIGGLAFLLLATVATILLRRRMRIRHTAPSAKFMGLARGTTPGPGSGLVRNAGTMTPSGDRLLSLAPQRSLDDDDDDRPPAFTSGAYADPVLEKVQVAAAMREQYKPHDSYYGGAQVHYKEETSEMGHEGESTQVGTEEGDYELSGDEKAGYYTWAM